MVIAVPELQAESHPIEEQRVLIPGLPLEKYGRSIY